MSLYLLPVFVVNGHYTTVCSFLREIACHHTGPSGQTPNKQHLPVARWMDVGSGGQFLSSRWPHYPAPGFNLPRRYWALLNRFRTNQGHCASCRKKWALHQPTLCPFCGKRQTMSHIVNSCPQSKLEEGEGLHRLNWWRCYRMAEDIWLVNVLDNNSNKTNII